MRKKALKVTTVQEEWKLIPEFPEYSVSSLGRVFNHSTEKFITPSSTQFGHLKVCFGPERHTRSLAVLVAEAFVDPPDDLATFVIRLDNDEMNVAARNLAWRPRWYAWKYKHQFTRIQPLHYRNLSVRNEDTREVYESVVIAGITEGLLFDDIWDSTYLGRRIYPYHHRFKIAAEI